VPAFVVDTNVPVTANDRGNNHADPACVIACIDSLTAIYSHGMIVLDEDMRILNEYRRNLSMNGEPGAGDAFMKWVWSVQADERKCERVVLTQRSGDNENDFEEFPDDPDLAGFDWSDRKFVAVVRASLHRPVVVNALDSDWVHSRDALERNGVTVRELCPQHIL